MSCGRASQIDVEAFLVDSAAAEFEPFRVHYPSCPECAAAVARWSAFDLALHDLLDVGGIGTGTHPDPERLEAYLGSTESLGEEAMRIEHHVAACESCQTELNLLRRFDPGLLLAVGTSSAPAPVAEIGESAGRSLIEGWRRFVESFSHAPGFGWAATPALALAAVVLVGLWWSGVFEGRLALDPPMGTPRLAQEGQATTPMPESPEPPSIPGAGAPDSRRSNDSLQLEERIATLPEIVPGRPSSEGSELATEQPPAETIVPEQLAQAAPGPSRSGSPSPEAVVSPDAGPEIAVEAPREEVLLAALTELPLPSYAAPEGAESLGWMRQFGAVRAGTTGAEVETRAPADHAGLSLAASPRLWWRVSGDVELPIQITIVDEEAIDPLLRIDLAGPHSAGLHAIDLARQGVTLEPGIEYRWFVSLIVDPDRPSRNPVSAGSLRVIAEDDSRRAAAAQALPAERGHTLARLGLWYDAYDFFASLAEAHPELAPIAVYRERMVALARASR